MSYEINGKVYRNIQEQVYENTKDINELSKLLANKQNKLTGKTVISSYVVDEGNQTINITLETLE